MPRQKPAIPCNIISIFFLLFLSFLTAGVIFYTIEKRNIKKEKYDELRAISGLKVRQLHSWYNERRGDAYVIMHNHNFGYLFNRWLADRNDPYFPIVFNDLASPLIQYFAYNDIILTDSSGGICFSINKSIKFVGPETKRFIAGVITSNKIIFTDFYQCSTCHQIHLDIMAPITGYIGGKSVITGVIILRIDPDHDVYKMIQSWPTPSKTAETLLVRREGNEVVYLNELRHRKHTALKLRYPLTTKSLPAVMAAEGKKGIVEGIDYRKVPVLADIRRIPDMPWYIVAKVDIDEIYAPIRGLLAGVIIVTALLIAGAAGGLSWWWNKQRLDFYKLKYESEAKYRALEMQFENLTRYANDIIIFSDENLKIIQVNERAVQAYGYTRDDLLGKSIRDIRSPGASSNFQEKLREAKERNGLIYETVHRRKDGTEFPVEISLRYLEHNDKKYYLGIIRDITERKRDEENIRALLIEKEILLKEVHHRVKNNMNIIASLLTLQASRLSETAAVEALNESSNRVMSMAAIYDILFRTTDFRYVSVNEYIGQVVDGITASLPAVAGVKIEKRVDDFVLDSKVLFPIGIIINELVTNAYKYAFPEGGTGTIMISVSQLPENSVEIIVSDNGVGISDNVDNNGQSGFGMKLVTMLVQQIDGTFECIRGGGTTFRINFKYIDSPPDPPKGGNDIC